MGVSINDYSAESLTNRVYSKYSNTAVDTNMNADDSSSYLDFEGYLKLLTAQMSNQDFNDSMSDSEFIQQMSSYSMMQAISELTKQNAVSYSSSLIGKAVTVNDGSSIPDTGIVEAVTVTSDGCKIVVNGNQYDTSSITDVVDGDVFSKLNSLVGHKVALKTGDDGESETIGTVTSIFIKNGDGYVTIDGKDVYPLSFIKNLADDPETEDENSGNADEEASESAEVEAAAAAYARADEEEESGVVTRSKESLDALMGILDSGSKTSSAQVTSNMDAIAKTAVIDAVEANSGLAYDGSDIPSSGSSSSVSSRIPEPSEYDRLYFASMENVSAVSTSSANSSYDTGAAEGVTSISDSDAASQTVDSYVVSSATSYGSSIPASTRKYADKYPVEAAFADSTGTHMVDIRFINNTDIMDRIDTSEILCYSQKGNAVTDLGWCGKGRLGEVATLADGRQRVEIIGPNSVSYYHTSGNYTLNELLADVPPGYFRDKLTPSEVAIIHYAQEYTEEEKAQLRSFGEYAARHAAAYYNPTTVV